MTTGATGTTARRERLVEVQKNGQLLVKYAYNPLGQRISKTLLLGSETTYYLYSEEGLVGEYDAQGKLKQDMATIRLRHG